MFHPKHHYMRNTLIAFGSVSFVLCALGVLYLDGYRYYTGSAYSKGIYQLTTQDGTYQHGDIVRFCPPDTPKAEIALERGYTHAGFCPGGFAPETKQIRALHGDHVSLHHIVNINGQDIPRAIVLDEDTHHQRMPHPDNLELGRGEYFLMSIDTPEEDFDSRYYGSVPSENILGVLRPIWTW